jgi:hypothetical protein
VEGNLSAAKTHERLRCARLGQARVKSQQNAKVQFERQRNASQAQRDELSRQKGLVTASPACVNTSAHCVAL